MSHSRLLGVPEPVTVRVPAKINLHLNVGALRPDGYHELITVFQAVALYDTVTATPARDLSLGMQGEGVRELPGGADNLAWKAAVLLADRAGVAPTVRLDLVKGIPVAGGLAGGSADAAATLVACDALWGAGLDRAELTELAAELGSDVAFALAGGTALGTGRGERLTPVLAAGRWHWVFAIAEAGLPTPAVYAELDRLRAAGDRPTAGEPDRLINALRSHDPGQLGELLANDLQAAAISLRPELRRTLRSGLDLGALGAVVSGSGPTCAFLARSREAAVRLAASLAGAGVCRTVRVAHGPVPGARVSSEPEDEVRR
ncbi:MAG TPA: 4-(cytidine 5'-diphospho)-2-C-methyl-D-erythritol kinase [Mycobacteriales bacterium]|nr:4-(cytidine 5'-diphospho)-2-C-methyl-D-erythritol kinase [Mycobacteriales bacterium]